MRISKSFRFEAAHRLQTHDGKCRSLHGHSYLVEVFVDGPNELQTKGSEAGMLLDFGRLNDWWQERGEPLDHITILEIGDPLIAAIKPYSPVFGVPYPPTAENLALQFQQSLNAWFLARYRHHLLAHIRVWETAKSWAEV